jgi:predicted permease
MRLPGLARWTLRLTLPPDAREWVVRDLEEMFAQHRGSRGRVSAAAWLLRQVGAFSAQFAVERVRERIAARRARSGGARIMSSLVTHALQDLRYGIRLLRRQPAFAAGAILTIALGVGASAAVFAVVNAVLLRPLPFHDPDRLVSVRERSAESSRSGNASFPDYLDWKAAGSFEEVAGHNGGTVTLTGLGSADRVPLVQVTDNFFQTLGVAPALGRAFARADVLGDTVRATIVTDGFWRRHLGADRGAVGRTLRLNGRDVTIVGVLPREFAFPPRGNADLYIPLIPSTAQRERRFFHWLDVIARVRPGVRVEQAREELAAVSDRIRREDARWHATSEAVIVPLRDDIVGGVRPALLVLLGAVGFVLLIGCANVANLLLARSAARRHEIGVRVALGAGPGRIRRQLLAEASLLALFGGAAGLLVARWAIPLLVAGVPERQVLALPHLATVGFDARIATLGMALSLFTVVLFSLVPAARLMRSDGRDALGESTRTMDAGHPRLGAALIVAEIAVALVLLAGAGLLARSFYRLALASPGFETEGVLTFRIALPADRYGTRDLVAHAHEQLLERFSALPGVTAAATINQLPLTGRGNTGAFTILGGEARPASNTSTGIRTVSTGYFAAQDLPILAGRAFDPTDRRGGPPVVVVNRTLADSFFPAGAVGRRIEFTAFLPGIAWEIIGVAGDEQLDQIDRAMMPIVYFAYSQDGGSQFSVLLRTAGDPGTLAAPVRQVVQALDPDLPVFAIRTMEEILGESSPMFLRRYLSFLVGAFACLAVSLAAVGVYGLLAYSVARRFREFGIRMALGASRGDVFRLVLGHGVGLAATGISVGLAAALVLTRFLRSVLYEVEPLDPLTFTLAPLVLFAVALAACWLPARRALTTKPSDLLRIG